jgi:gliding motility-associated-like protein
MLFFRQTLLSVCLILSCALLFAQPPDAQPDIASGDEDTDIVINVLGNDLNGSSAIDPASVDLDPSSSGIDPSFVVTEGMFAVDNVGVVTFTPVADFYGPVTTITYTVNDTEDPPQTSGEATIDVMVNAVNDAPTITVPGPQTIDEDDDTGALAVTIDDIDSPVAGLTLTGTSGNTAIIPDLNITFGGSGGSRTVTVVPAPDQNGGPVSIDLEVTDGEDPVQASFNVSVTAINDAPTITGPGPQTIDEDNATGSLSVTVDDIDNPVDGLLLSATSGDINIIPDANITFGGSGSSRTVTVTPAPDENGGPVSITLEVTDGTDPVQTSFDVSVTPVNDAPTLIVPGPQTIVENMSTGNLPVTVADVDNAANTLTLTGISDNTTIIPDANIAFSGGGANRMVNVTPAPDQTGGPVNIDVTVSDGTASNSANFSVTVNAAANEPPTITAIADQSITEDGATAALDFTIGDPDDPPSALIVSGISDNTAIIPDANIVFTGGGTSRTVTVSPAPDQNGGPVGITVEVTDGVNVAQTIFDVLVTAVNDPPTITGPGSQTIDEDGTTGALSVTVGDIDSPLGNLILSGSSGDAGIIPNANITFGGSNPARTVTVVPAANQNGGPVAIALEVTDGTEVAQTSFDVTVTPVNDAPTLVVPGPQTIAANSSTGPLPVTVADIDSSVAGLTLSGASDNSTIIPAGNIVFGGNGANRTVNVTPDTDQSGGPVNIDITVSDGMATNSADFAVTVTAVDAPPTISSIGNQTIDEDSSTPSLDFTIDDPDGLGGLIVSASSNNTTLIPNANIALAGTGADRTVIVTPAANLSGGPVTITIEVTDGVNVASTTFQVTVSPVNDAPTLVGPGPQSIMESTSTGALAVTVADIDTPVGTLTLSGSSDNTTLIPNTNITFGGSDANRTVTVTPVAGLSGGPVTITLTVSDGPASNVTTFTVTVGAVNDPPTITSIGDQSIPEDGSTGALGFTVGDPDDAAAGLIVSGTSDNTTLIPNGNIVFGGSGTARTVTVTPTANLSSGSPVVITVNVTDGTNTTSTTFSVTVTPVNDAPTLVGPGPQGILESTSTGALAVTVADVDNPVGSLALSGSSDNTTLIPNANIVIGGSGANRTVTVTPVAGLSGGPVTITLTVSDGTASNSTTFTVTVGAVNDPPTITSIGNQSIPEDGSTGALDFTVGDPDDGAAGLSVSGSSANTTLIPNGNIVFGGSGAARTVTVTPAANLSGGPIVITINVTDGTNTTSTTFSVAVTPVNDAPTLVGPGPQSIMESTSTGALAVTVADIDTPLGTLTLSGSSDNTTLIPNANIVMGGSGANRTVTVTPVAGLSGGPVTITLTISDGTASNATTFTVTVGAVNDPPTITAIGNQTIPEDASTGALAFTIGDPDDPVGGLIVSSSSDNTTLIPNANIVVGGSGSARTVTVTPVANLSGGPVVITLNVTDGTSVTATSFNVTVTAVNDPPTVAGPSAQTINENTSTVPLAVTVGDIETALGSLVLSGTSDNTTIIPNANIVFGGSGANRTVTVTPAPNQSGGPVTITLTVSDGTTSVPTTFTVTVDAVDDQPTISAIPDQTINEDVPTGALAFTIGDVDNPVGSLTITGSSGATAIIPNANIVIGGIGANRTVTVTPAANQSGGPVTITLTVSDGNSSTSTDFDITVTAVNDAPTITAIADQNIDEDSATPAIAFTITDVDNPASSLTVTGSSGTPAVIPNANIVFGGSNENRTVTVTPLPNQNGPVVITIIVSDGTANTPTSFDVTVAAINDAPTITSILDQTIAEDASTGPLPFTISDVDNPVASLAVTGSSDNTALVPIANIAFGGSGANRTVNVTPAANATGTAVITITVGDGTASASTTFQVTVNGSDDPPTITSIANQSTNEDIATGVVAFTVGDAETAAADLTVVGASDNTSLVPPGNIVIAGTGASRTVQITPVANQSGVAIITLTVSDGVNSTPTNFQLTVNTVNDAPTVTAIADQAINEDAQTGALAFTIGDVETAAGSLTVTGSSDNTAVIPNPNIVFGGSGANRTVQVTPLPNLFGTAVITVNVSDGVNTTSTTFQVAVSSVNDPATVTTISNQTVNEDNATGALAFTVGDTETAVAALIVTGSSDNAILVPNANITFGGSGASRTVTITPAANQNGTANITLLVNDGTADTPTSFQITVNALNDAPVITGQTPVATDEELALDIEFAHLVVSDPDDSYPSDFTLTVLANPGYTLSGNTITPNANVTGNLAVRVQVNDGDVSSNIFNLQVTVNPVNDPPVITAQTPISLNEDGSVTVLISHLTITDPDNTSGFTLNLGNGADYSVSGNVVTPDANYTGTLSVPVTVSDGTATSAAFNLQIVVNPVNDAPEITGQVPISIAEVQPVAIDLSQLTVFDPDNVYPDDFTLDILSGPNYSITGNTVIPVPNFSGTLLVRVFVNDGVANSAIYNMQILVNSTNDPPVITGQDPLSTNEGQAITIDLENLDVTDPDNPYPTGFTLTVLPGTNYTYSGNTITPNANFDGVLSVGVKVNDGSVDSAPFNLQISVIGINNAPTITGQYTVTTPEEFPVTIRLADLQVTDPDSPFPTGFTLTVSEGTNYTVSGHEITPAVDFNGTLSVPVVVNDGQLSSPVYNLQVQVTAANDPPVITGQNPLSTLEDQPIVLKLGDLLVTDVDNTFPTGFSLSVLPPSGTSYTVTGTTVTPALNLNGTLLVNVAVSDGAASTSFSMEISVGPVNDAPTLTAISNITIQEDPLDATTVPLTDITSGANEASQTLSVSAATDKPEWFEKFEVQYTGGNAGSLILKPKTNIFGTASVTVRVQDSGEGAPAPNVNFIERTFNFIIEPVNDPPVVTSQPITIAETGQSYSYPVVASDVEGEAITFEALALPAWLSLAQGANGSATLSGTPPVGTTGEVVVVLQVKDPADATSSQQFSIVVNTRPIIQPFSIDTDEDLAFDFASEFINSFTDADADILAEVQITKLPTNGTLLLGQAAVAVNDTIPASEIENLQYIPLSDSTGADTIKWNASDGVHYSLNEANVIITIEPVNDPPEIIALEPPQSDTLKYELGSEVPVKLTTIFDARDVDGDDLIEAVINFTTPIGQYFEMEDYLIFNDTLGIIGSFDETFGVLTLSGRASVKAYVAAIRSVRYNYVAVENFDLITKSISIRIRDLDREYSETKERLVGLVSTFQELDIASAFTPTGENPFWNIYSPNGLDQYKEALIRVYNKRGTLVYEAKGFSTPWNGDGPEGALPADSYFYTIDLKYDKKKYKGVVTILR